MSRNQRNRNQRNLSLAAAFDDLGRNTRVLSRGIEKEFQTFVENQQSCRRQWAAAEGEVLRLRKDILNLDSNNKALDNKLKHVRDLFEKKEQKMIKLEQDKEQVERQIALIRELLVEGNTGNHLDQYARERLAFLSTTGLPSRENSPVKARRSVNNQSQHSVLDDEDIDYWDKTEEDLISPCNGRPAQQASG